SKPCRPWFLATLRLHSESRFTSTPVHTPARAKVSPVVSQPFSFTAAVLVIYFFPMLHHNLRQKPNGGGPCQLPRPVVERLES
ncbi:MAG: hypothetical protein WAN11_05755, partial [Syntrophobacteraceae bacterium]